MEIILVVVYLAAVIDAIEYFGKDGRIASTRQMGGIINIF